MAISDIRKLEQQGYADYTTKDEEFFQRVDPSFEGYKNYGVVADRRSAVADAVQQAGGYYEAPDTSEKDLATLGTLGTAAINYGKWEPYASSLLKKGFPNASFSKATTTVVDGVSTTTYGASGASTPLSAAAGKYYSNLTSGTTAGVGAGVGTALVGYGIQKVFGDDDPTTYTAAEQIGSGVQGAGTGATIAALAGVAGPVGLAVGAFLGWRSGKRKQKKAIKEAKEQRQRDIEQAYLDNKVDYGQMAEEEEYLKNRAMFDNTYAMDQTDPNRYIPKYPNGGTMGSGGGPTGFGGYGGNPTSSGPSNTGYGQPNPSNYTGKLQQTSIGTPGYNPYFSGSYSDFINGLIGMQGPIINKGKFVGGAAQRSSILESQDAAGSAGNFLQRQENKEDNFYKTGQEGMKVPKRDGVRLNYNKEGKVIGESTHLMRAEKVDGRWVGFPSLFQNKDGTWIDMSKEKNWMPIYEEAKRRGEVIDFGDNKDAALKFGKGSWKRKTQKGEKGMKVAEVTGNEVIMPAERQNKIEKALASGDTETPGKIMKQTLSENKVTKGAASHDSNPMPIMSSGAVLDKNGNDTGLKANDGAGIYHQASKQFKKNMSNKQLSKTIAKNIASWKKQGKA